jgi:hypothetical protein
MLVSRDFLFDMCSSSLIEDKNKKVTRKRELKATEVQNKEENKVYLQTFVPEKSGILK